MYFYHKDCMEKQTEKKKKHKKTQTKEKQQLQQHRICYFH